MFLKQHILTTFLYCAYEQTMTATQEIHNSGYNEQEGTVGVSIFSYIGYPALVLKQKCE